MKQLKSFIGALIDPNTTTARNHFDYMGNTDDTEVHKVGRDGKSVAARLARILHGDVPWIETVGILTAANPLKSTTPENDNKRRNLGLYRDLLTYGIRQMRGWFGRMENPYLVANISRDRVIELGSKHAQESVIVGRCDRTRDCVMFELISTSADLSGRGPMGTIISARRTFLQCQHGTSSPDDQGPALLEDAGGARHTEARDNGGENVYSEHDGRQFMIPFFDDTFLKSEYQGSRVLNYYRHEIPCTTEAQQVLERFLARDRALHSLLSKSKVGGHAIHDRRGDQNLRLIELHELMGGWKRFPMFPYEDTW